MAHEQWDIVSSVGFTALLVAAGRAVQTNQPGGLVNDPYAERFVDRAQVHPPLPTRPDQSWPIATGDQQTADAFWTMMAGYQGVRSRFFDTVLAGAGAEQVVLLAAGLDTRAFRLDWPACTTVYEIDQEKVLEFKDTVLAEQGAEPRCTRRAVPVDLRDDWVAALRAAGFDPALRTAWLAEGLLPFLPAQAEADLFTAINELSAPGSTLAVEHFAVTMLSMMADSTISELGTQFGVDMRTLADFSPREHPAERLAAAGWQVTAHQATELARDYGRPIESGTPLESTLIAAELR